jgi:hypothetical protein
MKFFVSLLMALDIGAPAMGKKKSVRDCKVKGHALHE